MKTRTLQVHYWEQEHTKNTTENKNIKKYIIENKNIKVYYWKQEHTKYNIENIIQEVVLNTL